MILEPLGIYGWKESDENLLLTSLLTGDPLLLIGNHGCAKTHVANKIAQALGRAFLAYDASKTMFEDVLGYPNVEKLKQGVVEYVSSPVTIWNKEMVLIDELNRAVPELQSKWLEIIRSRKIMGFETAVKWVFAAMNPISYSATNALDAALVGRFGLFLYPPDVLQMEEEDRIRVALHINGDDAPSLCVWTGGKTAGTVAKESLPATGEVLTRVLHRAAVHFLRLKADLPSLGEFLARFSTLLAQESKGIVSLDGRRLGFIYRNILGNRAIEIAKAEENQSIVPDFVDTAKYVVQSSIPVGLNGEENLTREEANHKIEICFDLLSDYFLSNGEIGKVNLVYELFTTRDIMRKAELLLTAELGEIAKSKAYADLIGNNDLNITLLAYTALLVEARRPGTVPQEMMNALSHRIDGHHLSTDIIPHLEDGAIEYVQEIEHLLDQQSDLARLVAYQHVSEMIDSGRISPLRIEETAAAIQRDLQRFESFLENDVPREIAA